MIENDEQLIVAQKCVANIESLLMAARKVHSRDQYLAMAEPFLVELQDRQRDIVLYLANADRLADDATRISSMA